MDKRLSKFLSLILRHKPETVGISLDEHGWADVDELLEGIRKTGRIIDLPTFGEDCRGERQAKIFFQPGQKKDKSQSGALGAGGCGTGTKGAAGSALSRDGGEEQGIH